MQRWWKVGMMVVMLVLHLHDAEAINRVSYRGLTPGISTLADTERLLGKPGSRIIDGEQTIYKYRFMSVVVPKKTGKVDYIVLADPDFTDVNGFHLDTTRSDIMEKLGTSGSGNTLYDPQNGILYIFSEDDFVTQIIYKDITQ